MGKYSKAIGALIGAGLGLVGITLAPEAQAEIAQGVAVLLPVVLS